MTLDVREHLSSVQLQTLREQLLGQLLRRSLELEQLLTSLHDDSRRAGELNTLYAQITLTEAHTSHLHQALERMGSGDYGRCRICRDPIPFSRLRRWPLTDHCRPCRPRRRPGRRARTAGRGGGTPGGTPGGSPGGSAGDLVR